jgi:hypothetical protein
MKRLLVLVAVLIPSSLFVAGCGGTGGSSGKAAIEQTQQKQMEAQQKMFQERKMGKQMPKP